MMLAEPEVVLVRYGELSLKGGNRPAFEEALARNVQAACGSIAKVRVERRRGRLMVFSDRRVDDVAHRIQDVFGISSISPAWGTDSELEAIGLLAQAVMDDALLEHAGPGTISFRVRSRRQDKRFPLPSPEIDRAIGERLDLDPQRLRVDLKNPDIELGIEVRAERTYVYARRLKGLGGLPVGTLGRGVCLLSGGIDSPVAAWMAMKRGLRVSFVTFHSYPYIGESSKKKVVDLVRVLARYQPRNRLHVVPFTKIQEAIRDHAPPRYRTVLYRRMMQRIASRIAAREDAGALITGESLGQVASQTLENMTCIEDAAAHPVLRPLVAHDKQETIDIAQAIGTYDVSVIPEPDCCTVFQPPKPVIRGRIQECEEAEGAYDWRGMMGEAVAGIERIDVDAP